MNGWRATKLPELKPPMVFHSGWWHEGKAFFYADDLEASARYWRD